MSIFLIISIGFSQSSILRGIIKDSNNEEPLVGANVFLKETSLGTATINDGSYQITDINPGTYVLKATYIGYETKEIKIDVLIGENLKQDLELDYKTIEGETIEVTVQAKGQMDAINKQLNAKSIKISYLQIKYRNYLTQMQRRLLPEFQVYPLSEREVKAIKL